VQKSLIKKNVSNRDKFIIHIKYKTSNTKNGK